MSTFDTVLLALGGGDRAKGARVALFAMLMALPGWMAFAIVMALGPGR